MSVRRAPVGMSAVKREHLTLEEKECVKGDPSRTCSDDSPWL